MTEMEKFLLQELENQKKQNEKLQKMIEEQNRLIKELLEQINRKVIAHTAVVLECPMQHGHCMTGTIRRI